MSDPILVWNAIALETLRVSYINGQSEQGGPVLGARALAIVHLAMHDAYFGLVDPNVQLYSAKLTVPNMTKPVPAGSHPAEAVAGAAFTALASLYPSQTPALKGMLDSLGDKGLNSPSHQYGVAVANYLLKAREKDPKAGSTVFKPSEEPGKHRLDPDNPSQGFYAPDYGSTSPLFAATKRFALASPPYKGSAADGFDQRYLDALRQVRDKGIKTEQMSTVPASERRTTDQSLLGQYWAYDGATQLGTPPRFYNLIVRQVALAQENTTADNARLFALVNVALADAGILAWEQKYKHGFWRPVLGIREHHGCMGPAAPLPGDTIGPECDPQWLPLGAPLTNQVGKNFTPNFPAYPSGHATFGAAALHMTRLFYKKGGRYSDGQGHINDQLERTDDLFREKSGSLMSMVSEECNGISKDNQGTIRPRHVRTFPEGLWQMIVENGFSRMYLGVHWVFDAFLTNEYSHGDKRDGINLSVTKNENGENLPYGGVSLGLLIAENIFDAAGANMNPQPTTLPAPDPTPPETHSANKTENQATPDWTQTRS